MAERAAFPVKDESYVAGIEQLWSAPQLAVGNGPFVLQYLDPNSRALFKPNPRYWRGAPKVDLEVTYLPYGDALSAYMAGLLDIMALTTPQNVSMTPDEMLNNDLRSYPGACTYAVMFNQQRAPFDDPRVRQALAMALDRQALVDEVLARQGARSLLWIPPGYPGHNDAERLWEYDPEAASQFLAESSYGDSANLPPITATFSESPLDSAIWQWLQERWKGVVDVSIELEPVDPQVFPTLFDRVETAPQMFLGCWCALPDQHYWLGAFWRTGSPYAAGTGYSNPEFDVAVDEADRMPDPARRFELNATAQSLLMKDAPAVFAWSSLNNYLVKPWVKGLIPSPLDVAWPGSHDPLTVSIDTSLLPDH
jgi:oligopeptide transport system substrate-binding protein